MEKSKRKRLEKAGWRLGTAGEFLGLTKVEDALVEMKLVLGTRLRKAREQHQMTQTDLAKRIGSSQSRVAKMEAGDRSVSLDLLVRSLLNIGARPAEIAKWIKRAQASRAA